MAPIVVPDRPAAPNVNIGGPDKRKYSLTQIVWLDLLIIDDFLTAGIATTKPAPRRNLCPAEETADR